MKHYISISLCFPSCIICIYPSSSSLILFWIISSLLMSLLKTIFTSFTLFFIYTYSMIFYYKLHLSVTLLILDLACFLFSIRIFITLIIIIFNSLSDSFNILCCISDWFWRLLRLWGVCFSHFFTYLKFFCCCRKLYTLFRRIETEVNSF